MTFFDVDSFLVDNLKSSLFFSLALDFKESDLGFELLHLQLSNFNRLLLLLFDFLNVILHLD